MIFLFEEFTSHFMLEHHREDFTNVCCIFDEYVKSDVMVEMKDNLINIPNKYVNKIKTEDIMKQVNEKLRKVNPTEFIKNITKENAIKMFTSILTKIDSESEDMFVDLIIDPLIRTPWVFKRDIGNWLFYDCTFISVKSEDVRIMTRDNLDTPSSEYVFPLNELSEEELRMGLNILLNDKGFMEWFYKSDINKKAFMNMNEKYDYTGFTPDISIKLDLNKDFNEYHERDAVYHLLELLTKLDIQFDVPILRKSFWKKSFETRMDTEKNDNMDIKLISENIQGKRPLFPYVIHWVNNVYHTQSPNKYFFLIVDPIHRFYNLKDFIEFFNKEFPEVLSNFNLDVFKSMNEKVKTFELFQSNSDLKIITENDEEFKSRIFNQ